MNINKNQAASGKLGLAIALAANTSFAAGDREIAVLSFQVVNVSITQVTDITFGDTPIARQVADPEANSLSGDFRDGTLSISSGILNNTSSPGKTSEVVIRLQAKGEENAFGFTLDFNPNQLNFIEAKVGNVPGNAVFLVNIDESSSGKVGILLALPAGQVFLPERTMFCESVFGSAPPP